MAFLKTKILVGYTMLTLWRGRKIGPQINTLTTRGFKPSSPAGLYLFGKGHQGFRCFPCIFTFIKRLTAHHFYPLVPSVENKMLLHKI